MLWKLPDVIIIFLDENRRNGIEFYFCRDLCTLYTDDSLAWRICCVPSYDQRTSSASFKELDNHELSLQSVKWSLESSLTRICSFKMVWRCDKCNIIFENQKLYDTHKKKFCVGSAADPARIHSRISKKSEDWEGRKDRQALSTVRLKTSRIHWVAYFLSLATLT